MCHNKFFVGVLNSEDDGLMNDAQLFVEDSNIDPMVGMEFKNENEIFEFYKKYAYHIGFLVRKRTLQKNNKGVVTYVAFTCSREGRRGSNKNTTLNPQPTVKPVVKLGCQLVQMLLEYGKLLVSISSTITKLVHPSPEYFDAIVS